MERTGNGDEGDELRRKDIECRKKMKCGIVGVKFVPIVHVLLGIYRRTVIYISSDRVRLEAFLTVNGDESNFF